MKKISLAILTFTCILAFGFNNFTESHSMLDYPKTKGFITHGGTNSTYKAICHEITMVGFPMFTDQPDNIT